MDTIETFINFVQSYFPSEKVIPLHRPVISEKDKALVADALNSTYVSSVGKYVELFENKICVIYWFRSCRGCCQWNSGTSYYASLRRMSAQ